jgi:hypothetical protein
VRGHEFNAFGECLSAQAEENLAAAVVFIEDVLRARRFCTPAKRASNAGFHCVSVL